jgi:hypothetical protein
MWPLAAMLANDPASTPWVVLVVPPERLRADVADAVETLASLFDDPVEAVLIASSEDVLKVARERDKSVLVVHGLDALGPAAWRHLDANRSRLDRTLPAILMMGEPAAAEILHRFLYGLYPRDAEKPRG